MQGLVYYMKEKKRIFIQIDGSNFYHRLKELGLKNLLALNYEKLLEPILAEKGKVVLKKYYIGAIKEKEGDMQSKKLMKNQRKFLGKLQKNNWKIGFGHMLKTDRYHEKGVDVLIVVDMMTGAYEDSYDKVILISSDTDLLPAILKVKKLGKIVEYVGFSHMASHAMIDNCSSSYLLRKKDIEKCLKI